MIRPRPAPRRCLPALHGRWSAKVFTKARTEWLRAVLHLAHGEEIGREGERLLRDFNCLSAPPLLVLQSCDPGVGGSPPGTRGWERERG